MSIGIYIKKLKIYLQYLLPKHLLTCIVGLLAAAKLGKATTFAIEQFIKFYKIDITEMKGKITDYQSFNEFFSRPLKAGARPIDALPNSVIFPSDGRISQFGDLIANLQLQAKNHYFTLEALLGNETDAQPYKNGKFITIYLSPQDYHRVHMPFGGKLIKMTYIPGELFSVNPLYTQNIPELFARNERVVCHFKTNIGQIAVIFVGAAIVRSIITQWAGTVAPNRRGEITSYEYTDRELTYAKGEEIGKFMMGSTVICLFEPHKIEFIRQLAPEIHVNVGEPMAMSEAQIKNSRQAQNTSLAAKTVKKKPKRPANSPQNLA